ncbi:MAG TPA: hypothetical protein VHV57_09375 [Acidimicrobiales bacterium]|jgi:hypothetical protein|nr:hypothetical protein [Acidimicrobiales bacterium]
MGIMRILDATGDTTVTWSVQDAATRERAEAVFEQMLKKRHLAFAVPEGGRAEDAERVRTFDPDAAEIIWVRAIQGG